MKILLLIDSLYSGGAQRQIVELAVLLKGKGYDIKLGDYWDYNFYDDYLIANDINFEHRVAKGKINIFKSVYTLIRDFVPDVVICYLEHCAMIACVVKLLHITSPFRLIVSERNTTQCLGLADRIRFKLFDLAADVIVPNSYSQTDFIKKNYPNLLSKTVTITNYVDTDRFCPTIQSNTQVRLYESIRIIVVGRVVEQKNPIRFLEAIAKIRLLYPEKKFVVNWFGQPYPEDFFDICIETRKKLGLDNIVTFNPPTQNIIKEFQNSDLFVLPSIYEGFPNVLCEALSCGLPVVASAVCDNPMILNNGTDGILFDPNSVDDMAEKISSILNKDIDELNNIGRHSRAIAIENFAKEKFINSYISIL